MTSLSKSSEQALISPNGPIRRCTRREHVALLIRPPTRDPPRKP